MYKCPGTRLRPFSKSAGIACRGCSQPLQRAVVDFGADPAFGQVPDKLKEHYGITLPASTVRHITERHGQRILMGYVATNDYPDKAGCDFVIAEIDGSMIPIVEVDEAAPDKRKGKVESWKEARLCLAHQPGEITPHFGAVFQGTVEDAGRILFDTACQAGFGRGTYLHAVGDGAVWIDRQVDKQFGAQGHYLIDLFHVCEYLGAAAPACAGDISKKTWLEKQKTLLKDGQAQSIIDGLNPFLEPEAEEDSNAPVRACHRYLSNRIGQLDYPGALANGLPVGSGEIESAHRYIIQERLKLPGAWWSPDNARNMLALRVLRGNNQWENYWLNNSEMQ